MGAPSFERRYSQRQRDVVVREGLRGTGVAALLRALEAGELEDAEGKVPAITMPRSTAEALIKRAKRKAMPDKWEGMPLHELRDELRRRSCRVLENEQRRVERASQSGKLDPVKFRQHLQSIRELDALLKPDAPARPSSGKTPGTDGQPGPTATSTSERIAADLSRTSNATTNSNSDETNATPA